MVVASSILIYFASKTIHCRKISHCFRIINPSKGKVPSICFCNSGLFLQTNLLSNNRLQADIPAQIHVQLLVQLNAELKNQAKSNGLTPVITLPNPVSYQQAFYLHVAKKNPKNQKTNQKQPQKNLVPLTSRCWGEATEQRGPSPAWPCGSRIPKMPWGGHGYPGGWGHGPGTGPLQETRHERPGLCSSVTSACFPRRQEAQTPSEQGTGCLRPVVSFGGGEVGSYAPAELVLSVLMEKYVRNILLIKPFWSLEVCHGKSTTVEEPRIYISYRRPPENPYMLLVDSLSVFCIFFYLSPCPSLLKEHRHYGVAALFPSPPPPQSSCNTFFQFKQRSHLHWAAQTGQEQRHSKPAIPTWLCSIRHQKPQIGTAATTVASLQSDARSVSICLCL